MRHLRVIAGRPVLFEDSRAKAAVNEFFIGTAIGIVLTALLAAVLAFGWLGITILFSLS